MEMNMLEKIDNFGTLEKDEVAEFRLDVELMMELNQKMRDYLREITVAHMALMNATCMVEYSFEGYEDAASYYVDKEEMSSEEIEKFNKDEKEFRDSMYDTNKYTRRLEDLIDEINYQIDSYDDEKKYRHIEEQMQGMY